MKTIILFCRRNVGLIALSYLVAKGFKVKVISDDENVFWLAESLGCEIVEMETMGDFNAIISVHWNKFIPVKYFNGKPAYNVHPCLGLFKGHNPIKRFIENKCEIGSVDVHEMTGVIDEGKIIYSETFFTGVITDYANFYNLALPFYFKAIEKIIKVCG